MAQGDLFQNLIKSGGDLDNALKAGVISLREQNQIMGDLLEQQLNITEKRKELLKSDYKGLNVLKRMQSSGKKILQQQKEAKNLKKLTEKSDKYILELNQEIAKAVASGNKDMEKTLKIVRNRAVLENNINKTSLQMMRKTIPVLGRMGATGAAISDSIVGFAEGFSSVIPIIGGIIGGLIKMGKAIFDMITAPIKKAFGVFLDIQSTAGNLAADIGLTKKQSSGLLNNFSGLAIEAMKFGGTIKDVGTVMKTFSEATGKNRIFNRGEIGQLIELALGTGLGVEGASAMAASFDNIGISLDKTVKLTGKARDMAARYNVNTTKVLQTYQSLVESLTGIGFGKGLENLTKLAAKAQAIRFDIVSSTKAFTDTFFEPEKAVEAAAKMQLLGGKFAQSFGDPMQLAFESMNDPTALAEKFANTLKGIVAKDKNGDYFIPPADRKMLKMAAETLGQDYEMAAKSAIEQAKIADKMTALSKAGFSFMGIDEADKPALAALMKMNKNGKYEIDVGGGMTKLIENLADKNQLRQILDERKRNEDAAIERKNVMERLQLVVDRFMTGFSSVFTKLFGSSDFESFLKMIEESGGKIATFINDKILGSKGLGELFTSIIQKGRDIFDKISNIFSKEGGLGGKIKETLGLLFGDLIKPILGVIVPFLKGAWGALLSSLRDIPLVGGALGRAGDRMQKEALAADSTGALQGIYGGTADKVFPNVGMDNHPEQGLGEGLLKGAKAGKGALTLAKFGGQKLVGKGLASLGGGLIDKFGGGMIGKAGLKMGMFGHKLAEKEIAKHIPIIGSLVSAGFAIKDVIDGDYTGAALQTASAIANLFPGLGTAVSVGLDAADAARELGTFNDGQIAINSNGSIYTGKFAKGDMVNFIDQSAMERAGGIGSGYGSTNAMQHSGTITIKSEDGKVVTWDQMYASRDLIGGRISSINEGYKGGFGNYQNSNITPIQPIVS